MKLAAALAPLLLALAALPARADGRAPTIEHQPLTAVKKGEAVEIRARITSPYESAIREASVFIKVEGISGYTRVALKPVPGVPGIFVAQIPAALTGSGFAYYLEAFDVDGNGPARAGSPEAPFQVAVQAADVPAAATPAPAPAMEVALLAPPAAAARPSRSQLPTLALFALTGASLAVGTGCQVGYQASRSDANAAFSGDNPPVPYPASQYRRGQTLGTLSVVGFVVAGAALAGAITYLAWPDPAPAPEKPKPQPKPAPARAAVGAAP